MVNKSSLQIPSSDGEVSNHLEMYCEALRVERDDALVKLEEATEHIRHLEEMFRQSHKMEALGQLTSGIVHDFNNLLQVIIGNAELVLMDYTEGSSGFENLNEIRKASMRAADMTRRLLAFTRRQASVVLEVKSLNEVISSLVKLLQRMLGDTIVLNCHLATDVPNVKIDMQQLTQIITNLMVNARDAMNGAGTVCLETFSMEVVDPTKSSRVPCSPGMYAGFAVSDTGCGMDEAIQRKIFEPFFTTKKKGAGVGLGLATVFELVKQLKGGIGIESTPGKGTTFRIFFPVCDGAAVPVDDCPKVVKPVKVSSKRILLVDDKPSLVSFNTRMLVQAGYEVVSTCDAEEAVRIAEQPGEFDLLFSDVMLPKLNGWEMYQLMLKTRPELKALFVSGCAPQPLEKVLTEKAHFLHKPCSCSDVLSVIEKIIGVK